RIPSAYCGVFGLKPSRGRLPYSDYFNQLSTNHVVSKSVRDSAFVLDILRGGGNFDTFPTFEKEGSFLQTLDEKPKRLRIGVSIDWDGQTIVDDETKEAVHFTAKLLESLGHDVSYASPNFHFDHYAEQF